MKQILTIYILISFSFLYSQTETFALSNNIGEVTYESKDHRSNVYEVVSDRKIINNNQFQGIIIAATDYYPYGSEIGARSFSGDYRFGFQGQEKDEEVKGKGNSINYKYRMHDARVGRFFAVDPLAEKYPHYSSYQFSGNRVVDRIEYLGMKVDSTHADASMASTAVYGGGDDKFVPEGWNKSKKGENAAKILNIKPNETGLKFQLYERENSEGNMEYLMAFAGTEASLDDIGADIKQIIGNSGQYEDAAKISRLLAYWVGSENITFTGHSLGGGLAALSSYVTGSEAITFNAAGVSPLTLKKISESIDVPLSNMIQNTSKITAYIIKGDILDVMQKAYGLTPANGKRIYVDPLDYSSSYMSRHSIYNLLTFRSISMKIPKNFSFENQRIEPNTNYQLQNDNTGAAGHKQ